jgi:hypothetical protein
MKRGRWRDLLVLLLSLAAAGTVLSCPNRRQPKLGDGVTGTTPSPPFKWVYLEYFPADGDNPCSILVQEEETTIWAPPKKPHKVMWRVVDKDSDHKWVIRKKTTQNTDHFPKPLVKTIPCGPSNSFNSGPPVNTAPGLNTWDYGIEVYKCARGGADDELLCKRDPKIHIRK